MSPAQSFLVVFIWLSGLVLFCFAILGAEPRAFMYAGQALYTELLTLPCVSYVRVCNVCPWPTLEALRRAT